MRLPRFEYICPQNLSEGLKIMETYRNECVILAGGTDLLPRMKQGLTKPPYVMSLKLINDLDYIHKENGMIKIGARTSIASLIHSDKIQSDFPAFLQSLQAIGAPTIQHSRGTIGGNICQQSRCLFYNQSAFWRSGRQLCHKAGGKTCYAVKDSDRCHATFQSDTAPALIALNASVTLTKFSGNRTIPLLDLYSGFGEHPLTIEPNEILTEIQFPMPQSNFGSAYHRIAYRSAIDYPIASAAVSLQVMQSRITNVRMAIGAVSRSPLLLIQPAKELEGISISDEKSLHHAANQAMNLAGVFVADNVGSSAEYRIQMISVMTYRALKDAIKNAGSKSNNQ